MTNNKPDQNPDDPLEEQRDESTLPDSDSSSPDNEETAFLLESTVDSIEDANQQATQEADQSAAIEATGFFDEASMATVAINPFGIDKTPDDNNDADDSQAISHDSATEETDEFDDDSAGDKKTVVIAGRGKRPGENDGTISDLNAETVDTESTQRLDETNTDIDEQGKTVVREGRRSGDDAQTSLDQHDIGQTINPRELSDQDAKLWDSLIAGSQSVQPSRGTATRIRPAIERSITETNLQIRVRDVVTPRQSPSVASDYRLVRLLGKGGMGNVFVAKQASLDRLIAVKVIKPLPEAKRKRLKRQGKLKRVEADRRHQFLSEAVVTGDLDHPNIVPIHDIAVMADDTLFYAMKRVVGTPWSKVVKDKTRDENLDILMKVSDAIAFAHTRSVVHRDIKPENIMLGDFGVVLVMDWGLALAKPDFEKIDSIAHTAGLGGTPAFMAPEMVKGPVEEIGPASDVYLLGATLFLIITGTAPHKATSVSQCIKAVKANEIVDVHPQFRGELLDIAMKAMATNPHKRYPDVQSFQQAIRDYRSHSESISLATSARVDLKRGLAQRSYTDFSRATYGYEQAISLWDGNQAAQDGLAKTKIAHARAALENEDFDLGLSLLQDDNPSHQSLINQLHEGIRERDNRQSRLALFKRLAVAMLMFILVGGAVALYFINAGRNEAIAQRKEAVAQKKEAVAQRQEADTQRAEADRQANEAKRQKSLADKRTKEVEAEKDKVVAEKAKVEAEKREKERQTKIAEAAEKEARANLITAQEKTAEANQQRLLAQQNETKAKKNALLAQQQQEKAEYEVYVSQIGLVKARIEGNEFDDARRILHDLRKTVGESNLGWEWKWLWQQANQSDESSRSDSPLSDLSLDRSGRIGVAVLENGTAVHVTRGANGKILQRSADLKLSLQGKIVAAAMSPDGQSVVVGTDQGEIEVWNASLSQRKQRFAGHSQGVTDLLIATSGQVISASIDRTACVWDADTGKRIAQCWHIAPVRKLAATQTGGKLIFATGVSDSTSGRAVVWQMKTPTSGSKATTTRVGEFLQHDRPVVSIAISPGGELAATGDVAGNVYLWRPTKVKRTDFESSIAAAIQKVNGKAADAGSAPRTKNAFARLIDPATKKLGKRLVSTALSETMASGRAHTDVVRTVRFSHDGKRLLSGADDYTVKVWDVGKRNLVNTLRGHGGWITGASFIANDSNLVMSASKDASIRSWNTATYVDDTVLIQSQSANPDGNTKRTNKVRETRPHADEIWSARFDPSGTRIVSASRDHTARVLKIDRATMTFTEVARLRNTDDSQTDQLVEGTAFQAMSVAVDRSHGRIFVGNADSTVRIWDLALGTEVGQVNGTGLNTHLAVSRNGRLLMTGSSSQNAKALLWGIDPDNNKPPKLIYRLKGHDQAVTAFAISHDGRTLFTGDRIGIGWFWDTRTGQRIGSAIEDARGFRINAARFSPDGQHLWFVADDQQLTQINVATRQRVRRYTHDGFVTQLSLSADGQHAVTVSEQTSEKRFVAQAQLWNLRTGTRRVLDRIGSAISQQSENRSPKRSRITSAEFGGQSDLVTVSRSAGTAQPGRVSVWKMSSLSATPQSFQVPRQLGSVQAAFPLTTNRMLTLSGDAAFLWNLDKQIHEKSYRAHAALTQASFSFDGKYIATGSRSVKVWDANTGDSVGKLEYPHRGPVRSVQFAKVGPTYRLATCGEDGWAKVWKWLPEQSQFNQIHQFALKPDAASQQLPARCVAFSDDGKSLLAAGVGGIARVWSLENEQAPPSIYDVPDVGAFTSGAFSADGAWIVLGGDDKRARLWKVGAAGSTANAPIVFEGHADQIEDVAILQSGAAPMRVMTASLDKSARIWDPRIGSPDRVGRELLTLRKHTLGVTAIDATKDGGLIMTAGRDGAVILWPAGRE